MQTTLKDAENKHLLLIHTNRLRLQYKMQTLNLPINEKDQII